MKDVLGEAVMLDAWLQRRPPPHLPSAAQWQAAGLQGTSPPLQAPATPCQLLHRSAGLTYQRGIEALATKSHTRVLVFGCAKKKIYVRATSTHSCAILMSISCIG